MNNEKKEKLHSSEKWIHYQDVKVLDIKVKRTEKDEKKSEEFVRFIKEQIKKEQIKKEEDTRK